MGLDTLFKRRDRSLWFVISAQTFKRQSDIIKFVIHLVNVSSFFFLSSFSLRSMELFYVGGHSQVPPVAHMEVSLMVFLHVPLTHQFKLY